MPVVDAHSPVVDAPPDHAVHARAAKAIGRERITQPVVVDLAWLSADGRADVRVLDVRDDAQHAAGRIAGAQHLPRMRYAVGRSDAASLAELVQRLRSGLVRCAVSPHTRLVVVDDGDGNAELMATLIEFAGARHVSTVSSVVTRAWPVTGADVAGDPASAANLDAVSESWMSTPLRSQLVASFAEVEAAALGDADAVLLDVRSQLEHEGVVGAPCCERRGAIPRSLHLEWTNLFDLTGVPRGRREVEAMLRALNVSRDDRIIVTCHTAPRAAVAARLLRHAGCTNVRLSIGGTHEWFAAGREAAQ